MKDNKLIDRRFILGAAVGGSAVTLLGFLNWPKTDDTKSGTVVEYLRLQLINDPELQDFVGLATEALHQHSDKWQEAPISASTLSTLPIDKLRGLVRDDFKNNQTVTVSGWMISSVPRQHQLDSLI